MSIGIKIDESIKQKLKIKHNVDCSEVLECIGNISKGFIKDTRESHLTDPPTHWFVEQTDSGRWLFVAVMMIKKELVIKTAYEADDNKKKLYIKLTRK